MKKIEAIIKPVKVDEVKDELNKIGTFNAEINFHTEVKANIFIKSPRETVRT